MVGKVKWDGLSRRHDHPVLGSPQASARIVGVPEAKGNVTVSSHFLNYSWDLPPAASDKTDTMRKLELGVGLYAESRADEKKADVDVSVACLSYSVADVEQEVPPVYYPYVVQLSFVAPNQAVDAVVSIPTANTRQAEVVRHTHFGTQSTRGADARVTNEGFSAGMAISKQKAKDVDEQVVLCCSHSRWIPSAPSERKGILTWELTKWDDYTCFRPGEFPSTGPRLAKPMTGVSGSVAIADEARTFWFVSFPRSPKGSKDGLLQRWTHRKGRPVDHKDASRLHLRVTLKPSLMVPAVRGEKHRFRRYLNHELAKWSPSTSATVDLNIPLFPD